MTPIGYMLYYQWPTTTWAIAHAPFYGLGDLIHSALRSAHDGQTGACVLQDPLDEETVLGQNHDGLWWMAMRIQAPHGIRYLLPHAPMRYTGLRCPKGLVILTDMHPLYEDLNGQHRCWAGVPGSPAYGTGWVASPSSNPTRNRWLSFRLEGIEADHWYIRMYQSMTGWSGKIWKGPVVSEAADGVYEAEPGYEELGNCEVQGTTQASWWDSP